MKEIISAHNLSKSYGDIKAVDQINFSVYKQECLGLLGPNGAGKTTIVKMLYCYLQPTGGTLAILGKQVA
jgi:ABC-type multidrug transport system ATPase subunit